MRRMSGFTLIELMVTMAIIAILAAVAYPSYVDYVRRGVRSQGQQYLMDLAQRQEQFFIDQRAYAANVTGANSLNLPLPAELAGKYDAAQITIIAGPPAGFRIALSPVAGTTVGGDGTLIINNLQQRWRALDPADAAFTAGSDCRWEDSRCKPT